MKFRRRTAALAIAAGGLMAAATPALAAVGQSSPPSSPILLGKTATIFDRGVGATATTLIACTPGEQAFITVNLTERSGKNITNGYGNQSVNCNGEIQSVKVKVIVGGQFGTTGKPFVAGTAFGQATLSGCGYDGCNSATVAHNVKLLK